MNGTRNPCKCCLGQHITQPGTKRHEASPYAGENHEWVERNYEGSGLWTRVYVKSKED